MYAIIFLWFGSFGLDVIYIFYPIPYWSDTVSNVIAALVNICTIIWCFFIRSRLLDMYYARGISVRIGPILTFLLGPIYLNYKINEAKDFMKDAVEF